MLLIAGMSGCTLQQNVMWLPDSSGFLYPENGGHRISRYDLGTKKVETVIVETGIDCTNPAMNRAGDRIALAKYEVTGLEETKEELIREQIVIFDLEGKEVQRLPLREVRRKLKPRDAVVPVEKQQGKNETRPSDVPLFWSGPCDRLLAGMTLYNLRTGTWKELKVSPLPIFLGGIFGIGQLAGPSERGFLGLVPPQETPKEERLVFVNWEGEISEFQGSPPSKFLAVSFEWEGGTGKFSTAEGSHLYDTERMTYTFVPDSSPKLTSADERSWIYEFPSTSVILKLFSVEVKDGPAQACLVSIDPKTKRETGIVSSGTWEEMRFYPAPDGRKVAVRGKSVKDDKQEMILIVDEGGKVLDQLSCVAGSKVASWLFDGSFSEEEATRAKNME